MEITLNIKAPELVGAIQALAQALVNNVPNIREAGVVSIPAPVTASIQPSEQVAPLQQVPQQQAPTAVPTAPVQNQAPVQTQAPQQPVPVPTQAPTYDMNQLAVAATQLIDAGRLAEIQQLIASFGVQALTMLPQEQYGAFATKLRELGAKI